MPTVSTALRLFCACVLLVGGAGAFAPLAVAQSSRGAARVEPPPPVRTDLAGAAFLPADVSLLVRVDAAALAGSPFLAGLLERPEADHPLVRALARPNALSRLRTIYVGLPAGFTPESTELPVVLTGTFASEEMLGELASASGVRWERVGGREMLAAEGRGGVTYAAALADGVLALGDLASLTAMIEVAAGRREGLAPALAAALGPSDGTRHLAGTGRVPPGLRGFLEGHAGGLAAPFAGIDRLTFGGSLGRTVQLDLSLEPTTADARQAVQQALGALQVFGPSRYANDPEALSAIQSLRFTSTPERIDVSATLTRGLLLRLL
jgi:hypothetical protein